jgi:glutamate-5-semialdehyde dehydrogenase
LAANAVEVAAGQAGMADGLLDRLPLTPTRVQAMADGVRSVAALPDPVGRVLAQWPRPNGLTIRRVSIPIGVIAMIYEARPNVTADAAALCLKSGNAVVLRPGR